MMLRVLAVVLIATSLTVPVAAARSPRDKSPRCEPDHHRRGSRFHANVRTKVREMVRTRVTRAIAGYRALVEEMRGTLERLEAKLGADAAAVGAVKAQIERSKQAESAAGKAADDALWGAARDVADVAQGETANPPTQSTKGEDP